VSKGYRRATESLRSAPNQFSSTKPEWIPSTTGRWKSYSWPR
ncbi:hypothetical protein Csa_023721, partial [Cucumis sativus]